MFPSQPSFFMQARCLSRSVENVQCSEYMHCFPQNEDSKSLPVSLGCEGWPGPITSHRTVSQSPGSPVTRYPVHAACIYSTACISIPVTRTRSVHSGVHTLQRPPPAPAAAQLCPMGLTLSVLTYTISTSILHERLTYVLNFMFLAMYRPRRPSWGEMYMYMFRRRTSCGSPGLRCAS